jgi:polygalacturonase
MVKYFPANASEIQNAIDTLPSATGGEVYLPPGVYPVDFEISRSNVWLRGSGNNTILQPDGPQVDVITIPDTSQNITISDLQLDGKKSLYPFLGDDAYQNGVFANRITGDISFSKNLLIERLYVHDFAYDGIYIGYGGPNQKGTMVEVQGAEVLNSYLENNNAWQVEINTDANASVVGNTISGGPASGTVRGDIGVFYSVGVSISNNQLLDQTIGGGIQWQDSDQGIISGNRIQNMEEPAIHVSSGEGVSKDIVISSNDIQGVRGGSVFPRSGIHLEGTPTSRINNITVQGNNISNTADSGIIAFYGDHIRISDNGISNASSGYGLDMGSTCTNAIITNNIFANCDPGALTGIDGAGNIATGNMRRIVVSHS